jgi:hypothetical protein
MTRTTQSSQSSLSLTNVMPASCIARIPEPEIQDCDPQYQNRKYKFVIPYIVFRTVGYKLISIQCKVFCETLWFIYWYIRFIICRDRKYKIVIPNTFLVLLFLDYILFQYNTRLWIIMILYIFILYFRNLRPKYIYLLFLKLYYLYSVYYFLL